MAVGNVVGSGAPIRYAPLAVTWLWSAIRPSPTKNREAEKFDFLNKEKRRTERPALQLRPARTACNHTERSGRTFLIGALGFPASKGTHSKLKIAGAKPHAATSFRQSWRKADQARSSRSRIVRRATFARIYFRGLRSTLGTFRRCLSLPHVRCATTQNSFVQRWQRRSC